MNTFTKNTLIGVGFAALIGIGNLIVHRSIQRKKIFVYPDSDIKNNSRSDVLESPKASTDSAEKGFSQLDSAYRSEWQGMGYPQTHRNINKNDK